ncbi:14618_t:CDS:2, partial [Acaulospora colombiana]
KCTPEKIFHPANLQDLREVVIQAKENKKKIRCAASGHTWSSLSVTSGYLVVVDNLNAIEIKFNEKLDSWTVSVEAGVYLKNLDKALRSHDPPLSMDSSVVLNTVTAGADGELREFSDDIDEIEMSAARVNLGLLGIIYKLTFIVEPMFKLRMIDIIEPMSSIWNSPSLKSLVDSSDSIEVFYWPFNSSGLKPENDKIWIKQYLRTMDMPTVDAVEEKTKQVFQSHELEFGDYLYDFMAKEPKSTPFLDHLLFTTAINHQADQILEAPDAIHWQAGIDAIKCQDLEFAIKLDKEFKIAIEEIYEYAAKKIYPLNLSVEFRINKSSQNLLAPTYDPDPNAYFILIEVLSVNGTEHFQEFSIELAKRWMELYDARPHWAKLWEHVPEIIPYIKKHLGERGKKFENIRNKYDPEQMFFDNKSLKEILLD